MLALLLACADPDVPEATLHWYTERVECEDGPWWTPDADIVLLSVYEYGTDPATGAWTAWPLHEGVPFAPGTGGFSCNSTGGEYLVATWATP